jgi:TPR repeat protein
MKKNPLLLSLVFSLIIIFLSDLVYSGDYQDGEAAYKKGDFEKAFEKWKPLAEKGNATLQSALGMMYARGMGVPQDYTEAVKWFRLGAKQGNKAGQAGLGSMYIQGHGVTQDFKEAVKWFRLAAAQGFSSGQYSLGLMYKNGQGVTQDFKEAVKWFGLAADQNEPHAQYSLGKMYIKGQGVPKDYILAYYWFSLAGKNGLEGGVKASGIVEKKMTPAQIIEAKEQVKKHKMPVAPVDSKETTSNSGRNILLIIIVVIVGLWLRYKSQLPKAKTRELAMIVWSSFGPYSSADDAETSLRRALGAVFGKEEGVEQHEEWIKGHIENFNTWEKEGNLDTRLNRMIKGLMISARGSIFNEARQNCSEKLLSEGEEAMETLNKEFLEKGGKRLEYAKREDGSTGIIYKKILSDEEIKKKEEERNQTIAKGIGQGLLENQTKEGKQLVEFLKKVWREDIGGEIETAIEIGDAWWGLFSMQSAEPDSDRAKTFNELNDACDPPKKENNEN